MLVKRKKLGVRRLNPKEGFVPLVSFACPKEFEKDPEFIELASKLTGAEIEFAKAYIANGRKANLAVEEICPQYNGPTAKTMASSTLANPDVFALCRYFDRAVGVSNRPPTMDEIIARLTEDWRVTTDPKLRLSLTEKIVTYLKLDQTKVSDPEQQAKLDNQTFLQRFLEEDEKPVRKSQIMKTLYDPEAEAAARAAKKDQPLDEESAEWSELVDDVIEASAEDLDQIDA